MTRSAVVPRLLTALVGLLFIVFALLFPLVSNENLDNGSGEREKMEALYAGDVMEQSFAPSASFNEVSLHVDGVRESKGLTLNVTLLRSGQAAASETFPLAKVRAGGRLRLTLPAALPAGDYTLRVEAVGEGNVKLGGQSAAPCTVNGVTMSMGCAIRAVTEVRTYGKTTLYCGGLLLFLACVPSGGGAEKKRVRVKSAPRARAWLLPCALAAVTLLSFLLSAQSAALGLGAYNLQIEDELSPFATLLGLTLHLPLLFFALCAAWCAVLLLWELTFRELRLHRITFIILLFGGLMMALCKPTLYLYGWDEGAHREIINCIAGTTQYSLPELTVFSSTWWFGYVPNVLGMLIGKLLGLSEPWLYRLGFVSAAALYALLGAEAVRHAPKYKLTFLLLAALPTCIVIASDFTYDAMTIAGMLLGTALLLEELASPTAPLSARSALRMVLVLSLCTLAKPAYSFGLLLLLFLPKSKFKAPHRRAEFRAFVWVLLLLCLGTCLLGSYADMIGGDSRMEGTDSAAQLRYVLADPAAFLLLLGRYTVHDLLAFFPDAAACWGQFSANGLFSKLFLALLFLVAPLAAAKEADVSLTAKRRVGFGALAFLPLLVLMVTQYMVSTEVGSATIFGMQPRYVLPILPPLCLALMLPEGRRVRAACLSRLLVCFVCVAAAAYFFIDGWGQVLVMFFGA